MSRRRCFLDLSLSQRGRSYDSLSSLLRNWVILDGKFRRDTIIPNIERSKTACTRDAQRKFQVRNMGFFVRSVFGSIEMHLASLIAPNIRILANTVMQRSKSRTLGDKIQTTRLTLISRRMKSWHCRLKELVTDMAETPRKASRLTRGMRGP